MTLRWMVDPLESSGTNARPRKHLAAKGSGPNISVAKFREIKFRNSNTRERGIRGSKFRRPNAKEPNIGTQKVQDRTSKDQQSATDKHPAPEGSRIKRPETFTGQKFRNEISLEQIAGDRRRIRGTNIHEPNFRGPLIGELNNQVPKVLYESMVRYFVSKL
ncbi:unnamed protein product [Toxocara canis]|uniref:Reverse transcriptase domain-containing protein n=1 Tax=Toxocara canis TaxID=6265 RepID=A0A183TXS4_TOXCA|nr:unnamed protein product [Toxocara canis]